MQVILKHHINQATLSMFAEIGITISKPKEADSLKPIKPSNLHFCLLIQL